MNLILFGPPGAGKGTQAQLIAKKFNYYQLSTGELLRSEIKNKTQIGKEIEKIISEGDFATDDLVNTLLRNIITNPRYKNKIIFDGYPRNIQQAKSLEKMLEENNQDISCILYLNVSRKIIQKRIMGRLTCEKCNKTLNEFFNRDEIESHSCGKNYLKKRTDDNQESIITRYDAYMDKTKPMLDFYSGRSYFNEINGSLKINEIRAKIDQILKV